MPRKTRIDNRANAYAGTIVVCLVIGIVGIVGGAIFAKVANSASVESGSMAGTSTMLVWSYGNVIEFLPVLMLVLLAIMCLAVVQRMH